MMKKPHGTTYNGGDAGSPTRSRIIVNAIPSVISRAVILVTGIGDGSGGVVVYWEMLKRLRLSEFARLGLNELEPLRVSENDLEPLAEVEGARGGVVVDWEMVSKEVVTTPGRIGLNELERLADTVGNGGGVIVGWEMVIGLVTVTLDELEQLARTVDVRSKRWWSEYWAPQVVPISRCREGDYPEKQVEEKKRRRMGKGREKCCPWG
ncbi:hypothetical protein BGY98DRAFT_930074 [Russula aff. rugulosa BPL654]|nr:hypothetical protein BGY98DRAFT_930074 [Russula aff. rugulosa BPL654]